MFTFPDVAPFVLGRAPLVQAVAQVKFPLQARLATLEGIARVQEGLNARYPYLEPAQMTTLEVQIGPNGVPQAAMNQAQQRFVFRGDDGFSVQVAPDTVNLTAGREYAGSDDFKDRFEEILNVLQAAVPMVRGDRVAARFLNLAPIPPGDELSWARWFRKEVTGWPGSGIVAEGARVQSAISQVQMTVPPTNEFADFPGDVTALIRTGLVPAGSMIDGFPPVPVELPSFVMDLDLFTVHPQAWSNKNLSQQFAALHAQIERFFRWSLTADGEKAFDLEELA